MQKKNQPDPTKQKPEDGTLADDQAKRGYYYDDAYGYEDYDPGPDDDIGNGDDPCRDFGNE
ncbi:MAG TPA: hypothetical protein PKD24_13195 [Pyrinomonadaceae bacterium]|nr:hypothetical protein [Pyrinomonadaceae bacterium]HMP66359.1 hypothetical protein [Pyrinomonadaceae bacterium]